MCFNLATAQNSLVLWKIPLIKAENIEQAMLKHNIYASQTSNFSFSTMI
jgi:hypothetical protein